MRTSLEFAKKHFGDKLITAVEVGVAAGRNSLAIKTALRVRRLILIDRWHSSYGADIFDWQKKASLLHEDDRRVIIIKAHALDAANLLPDDSIDYLYIDDDHAPDHVYSEIDRYIHKVRTGGIIAGHDYIDDVDRVAAAVRGYFGTSGYNWAANAGEEVGDWWAVKK